VGKRRFGSVRRTSSGRWQARYSLPDGSREAAPQMFATKTDALRFLAMVESDLLRGVWVRPADAPGAVTVASWAQRYVAAQRGRLTPKTFALYESLLRSCIVPAFDTTLIHDIQKIAVREWMASLSARGLSASRVRHALVVLSQVMAAAVEDGLIASNPCTGVRPPRLRQTEPHILTPAQVAALHDAIRLPYGLLVDLLAYGGLRIGEAFALRRRCVDLEARAVVVEESLAETGGRLSFGPTKTHQKRLVALPQFLVEELREHLAGRVASEPEALLFVGRTGQPLHYNAFRRWTWDPAVLPTGLVGVTPHDLRATCASWVADTAGVLEAAKRLGHARTSVTTRHYARPVEGRDRDVAGRLDELRPPRRSPGDALDWAQPGHKAAQRRPAQTEELPLTRDDA
jgi:integrase